MTPYDTALRAVAREVDAARAAVGAAVERFSQADADARAAGEAIVRESALAADHGLFSADAWLARAGMARDRLAAVRAAADAELETSRERARTHFGSFRVLETAADGFRQDAARTAASAEQARIDDFAGARIARKSRRARPSAR